MPVDPALLDPSVAVGNQSQVDTLRSILNWGAGAAALGAGARGISGLGSFLNRNMGGGPRTPMRQSFVRIPVPVEVRSRAERDAMLEEAEREKEAELVKLADVATTVADWAGLLRRPFEDPNLLHKTFAGWGQESGLQKPWTYPAAGAALGGGLYGGWKLTDYLLDKTKNVEQESELEAARKDYEEALASRRKVASAPAAKPLDALADLYEKQALVPEMLGLGLLGMGGVALGTGMGAYNWTRSVAEDKAVEEAVKRRQAQIAEQAPSPVMAIPTPMPVYHPRRSWHHLGKPEKEKGLTKASAETVLGGPISRATASTLGRAGNVLSGMPIMTLDTLRNPQATPERIKEHEKTVKDFSKVRPQQLSDVKVRLGGTDLLDDLKRVWTNERSGPIGKVMGTVATPVTNLLTTLTRGSHYNPESNTVVQFAHNQPITQHELGHAIDFNRQTPSKHFWERQGQGTLRDLYRMAYGIPGVNLWHEAMANHESRKALEQIHKHNPAALRAAEVERLKVLPAGYGSYVGNALAGPYGALPGMIGGKVVGMGMSEALAAEKDKKPHKKNDMKKAANVGQAADQFLNRIKGNQMAVWQRLMTPTDGKPAKQPAKPAEPAPPQLPTLAGTRSRMTGQ